MYELMFGITGSPFRLTPDPDFYFDGQAHRAALETLRTGIWQTSGFTVLTGDIGAGKTTLLRTLIAELVAGGQVVGEIVSSQLGADEILLAAAHAFRRGAGGASAATAAQALFDFFATLGAEGRSAILTVDEAHKLSPEALLQLVRLSLAAATQRVPLHVFLVGQTELRALVDSAPLAPLRMQIRSTFHLGPLAADEVRAYVEHRLRTVSWKGNPSFEDAAFAEIFRWTDGVPRRINQLCSRLLLSSFLDTSSHIAVATVTESAQALLQEFGETDPTGFAMVDLMTSTSTHRDGEPVPAIESPAAPEPEPPEDIDDERSWRPRGDRPQPVLCLVAEPGDFVDAAALMRAMPTGSASLPMRVTRIFRRRKEEHTLAAFPDGVPVDTVDLELGSSPVRVHGGELRKRFIMACEEADPCAIVVFRPTDAALVCSIVARQKRIPVVSVGPAARERRAQARRDELAKRIWTALRTVADG